jgi:putative DNA-invertase from lambdoid prophage Rac
VVADEGASGVSTELSERDNGKRLFDILRPDDILVVRWVDRLGRNYMDVRNTIRRFMKRGVIIRTVINGTVFDGSTTEPMQMAVWDAIVEFMAAPAPAGIDHAKVSDAMAYGGRKPSYDRASRDGIIAALDSPPPVDRPTGQGIRH